MVCPKKPGLAEGTLQETNIAMENPHQWWICQPAMLV